MKTKGTAKQKSSP